jgi:tape measure domain-containing protein
MARDLVLGIRLTADGSALTGALTVTEQQLARLTRSAESAGRGVSAGLKPAEQSALTLSRAMKGVAAVTGVAIGVESIRQLAMGYVAAADAMTNMQARLNLVTGSLAQTTVVQARLYQIAQASRVSFVDLAGTYAQMARAAGDAGISQDRLLNVTQALSRAITISGGSAASTQAAMVQLSQGLASGTLRGEELNSILEQTPRVAQAIAQGLGVGIGALRKLGEEGRLTTEVVIGALEKAAPMLAAEFGRMTPTVAGSFTTLSNSVTSFVGVLDRMTGTSSGAASAIISIASALDTLSDTISTNPAITTYLDSLKWAATGGIAGSMFRTGSPFGAGTPEEETRQLQATRDSLMRPEANRTEYDRGNAARRLPIIEARLAALREQILAGGFTDARDAQVGDPDRAERMRASARTFLTDDKNMTRDQRRAADIEKVRQEFVKKVEMLGPNPAEADLAEFRSALKVSIDNVNDRYKPEGLKELMTDRKAAAVAGFNAEREAVESIARRQIAGVESLGRQGLRTEEQVTRERAAIQLRAIAGQTEVLTRQRAAAGADLSDRARITGQINALAEQRKDVDQKLTDDLSELSAKRAEVYRDEAQSIMSAQEAIRLARVTSIEQLADEVQARRESIVSGREESEVLREIAIARLEAMRDNALTPDPMIDARLTQLREELGLIRERNYLGNLSRGASAGADPFAATARAGKTSIDELKESIEGFGRSSSKTFADYVVTGESSFSRVREAFIKEMVEMYAYQSLIRPLAQAGTNMLTNMFAPSLGGASLGTTDAGRAASYAAIDGVNIADVAPISVPKSLGVESSRGGDLLSSIGASVADGRATKGGGGGVTYSPTINVDSRADRLQVLSDMRAEGDRTIARIADMQARGSRALER